VPALAHDRIHAPGGDPRRYALFVHGILGTKANWRGIARAFVKEKPDWGALTVDLPMHGDSQGFDPPWTLANCAEALMEFLAELDLPTQMALGHSFGGKVVLELAARLAEHEESSRRLQSLWIVDSPPGRRDDPAASDSHLVISKLRRLPSSFASRKAFAEAAAEEGLSKAIATWLAMNLRRVEGGFVFPLDLDAITALLNDYFATDSWDGLETMADGLALQFIVGGKSTVFLPEERKRLDALASAGLIDLEVVEDAGHWVHAERPDRILEALVSRLD
jgi:pimeloyl-ACP methyl ester carboxylesterase